MFEPFQQLVDIIVIQHQFCERRVFVDLRLVDQNDAQCIEYSLFYPLAIHLDPRAYRALTKSFYSRFGACRLDQSHLE